jgi:NAD(P)-dependent dehydrogenase (short-subunit alcohol dehydrogenase family)
MDDFQDRVAFVTGAASGIGPGRAINAVHTPVPQVVAAETAIRKGGSVNTSSRSGGHVVIASVKSALLESLEQVRPAALAATGPVPI